jgi:hypothetical protein
MADNESLYSVLVLDLFGDKPEHAEFQALFELANDALADNDGTKKAITLATLKLLAEQRQDMVEDLETEGTWCDTDEGFVLVMRDTVGNNAYYNPDTDNLVLQRNLYKVA